MKGHGKPSRSYNNKLNFRMSSATGLLKYFKGKPKYLDAVITLHAGYNFQQMTF